MQVSHNKFSDWFDEEYQSLLGAKVDNLPQAPTEMTQSLGYFSDTVDWRNSGAVNQIVDQGNCGSCYAFASTAAIESAHQIRTGQLLSLSKQQVVDCSLSMGNQGCNFGYIDRAFNYSVG